MKTNMKDPKNWIPRDIFQSYCGTKSDKLMAFYDKAVGKKSMMPLSLNWLAILLLPAWLGYRRQWAMLTTFAVIISLSAFIEAIFDINMPNSSFTGVLVALGLMGNGLLLLSAHGAYMKLKKNGMTESQIQQELKDKAEPSVQMAFAGFFLTVVIIIVSTFLADYFFGLPY